MRKVVERNMNKLLFMHFEEAKKEKQQISIEVILE
jgi:hypothetical protein